MSELPLVDGVPDPPPDVKPPKPWSAGGAEPLTNYALGVYLEYLLAA